LYAFTKCWVSCDPFVLSVWNSLWFRENTRLKLTILIFSTRGQIFFSTRGQIFFSLHRKLDRGPTFFFIFKKIGQRAGKNYLCLNKGCRKKGAVEIRADQIRVSKVVLGEIQFIQYIYGRLHGQVTYDFDDFLAYFSPLNKI